MTVQRTSQTVATEMIELLNSLFQSDFVDALVGVRDNEPGSTAFEEAIQSRTIWGGSGSIFDQAFADISQCEGLEKMEFNRRRQEFLTLLLELGERQLVQNGSNAFIQNRVDTLRQWLSQGGE